MMAGYASREANGDVRRAVIAELRSDTFTQPDGGMLEAMRAAECGDDVYGEDETVNLLQDRLAQMTGKARGLFLSSGTQSNLVAMLSHCGRGEEVISGDKYHVVIDEAMGASVLGGLAVHSVATDADGVLSAAAVEAAIKPEDIHCPISRLVSLENTVHGRVQPAENFHAMRALADAHGLRMHLDGARLFNAVAAGNYSLAEICAPFDSVSLCLSKGLGAPVGTVLCGDEAFIGRALRLRKMLGGGMRQVGFLAAAGLYAIENNIARLHEDHMRAMRLCSALKAYSRYMTAAPECHTNMVFIGLSERDKHKLAATLAAAGVMIANTHPQLRLVIHKDIDDTVLDYAVQQFAAYYEKDR